MIFQFLTLVTISFLLFSLFVLMLLGMVLDSAFADLTMLAEEMVRTVRTYSMNISNNIVRVVLYNIIICVVLFCVV